MPEGHRRGRSDILNLLANEYRYGLYFLGSLLSNFGNWCQTLAGILLVYRLSDSVLLVGIASVVQFIWPIVLGPWVGMVADRFNRRTVLIVTQLLAAAVSGALAALTLTDTIILPVALLMIGLLGVLLSFQAPAQLALIPLLVRPEQLEYGLSLSSSQFNLARAIGPVIASALVVWGGLGLPFLFNAVSFLAYVVLLRFIRPKHQDMPKSAPRLKETVAAVMSSPAILPLFALGFVISGSTDAVNTLGPAISVELTGADEWTGWFITAFGVGALVSAVYIVPLMRRVRRRLPWTMGLQALGALCFALAPAPWVAIIGAGLFGVGFILSSNRALSIVQTLVSPDVLGRVTAVWLMAYLGGRAFYALVSGAIADLSGPRIAAVVVALTIAIAALAATQLGRRENRGMPEPSEPSEPV